MSTSRFLGWTRTRLPNRDRCSHNITWDEQIGKEESRGVQPFITFITFTQSPSQSLLQPPPTYSLQPPESTSTNGICHQVRLPNHLQSFICRANSGLSTRLPVLNTSLLFIIPPGSRSVKAPRSTSWTPCSARHLYLYGPHGRHPDRAGPRKSY